MGFTTQTFSNLLTNTDLRSKTSTIPSSSVTQQHKCTKCPAAFSGSNALKMHMQTHLLSIVKCPRCSSKFRSSANVLQHIESGYCRGTRGKEVARKVIYRQAETQFCLNYADGYDKHSDVPDFPYKCPSCDRFFQGGGQCLQHQEHKHDLPPSYLNNSVSD